MTALRSISIAGTGNVAFHLGKALVAAGWKIGKVYGRNRLEGLSLARTFNATYVDTVRELDDDLILLCVKDDAIPLLASEIDPGKFVAHTSGSMALSSLDPIRNKGVLYPLQTFTIDRDTAFSKVPVLIESNSEEHLKLLAVLAGSISEKVVSATSEDRKTVHLSAVYVNNFVNHLALKAKELMDKKGLDWELLQPLLSETILKLEDIGPLQAQTGPARRNDQKTITSHLDQISGRHKEIYEVLTRSIQETYGQS